MDYRNVAAAQPYRGIRNNNPGNLEYDSSINWTGQVGADPIFAIFSDTSFGLRALAMDLVNKITKDGYTTITAIITAYAPANENNVPAYISSVAGDTGLDPNATVPLDQPTLHSLMLAIINHEEGAAPSAQFIQDTDIDGGINLMPAPLLNLFTSGPNLVDQNQTFFGIALLGGLLGAALLIK